MAILAKMEDRGVIIGLERGNIDKLIEGKPFHKNLAEFGGEMFDIIIIFGETQDDIVEQIKGGIDENTIIQDWRDRKKQ